MKEFNVAGKCIPSMHYMVDTTDILEKIRQMIDGGKYFTINRARQYGKTTTFGLLRTYLKEEYYVLVISFEASDTMFESVAQFNIGFLRKIAREMKYAKIPNEVIEPWIAGEKINDFERMGDCIENICNAVDKKIVLLIDEVDKSSDNQIFLSFLGMLRNLYLERDIRETFQSVILAGVYDIKNLKLKLRPYEERKYNSPWNIAVDFDVDMSLSAAGIAGMLREYEADYHTGMNIEDIAQLIYDYTSGYPFLVSRICLMLHERDVFWNEEGVRQVVKVLLNQTNTLFDDMIKNLEHDVEYRKLVEEVVFGSEAIPFRIVNPLIARGVMFGVLKEVNGSVSISNKIFEMYIYEYFISVNRPLKTIHFEYLKDGQLDMEAVLRSFQKTMNKMKGNVDDFEQFIESQGRLLLVAFFTPILNGTGHYVLESWAKDKTRMDMQVFYGTKEYIVELKIWHGVRKEEEAYRQLSGYMESRGIEEGYLINFCFQKNQSDKAEWIEMPAGRIFEINV